MNIWVLALNNEDGTKIRAFASRALIDAALAEYCRKRWAPEFTCEAQPSEDDDLVKRYFDMCKGRGEDWHIGQLCELEGW